MRSDMTRQEVPLPFNHRAVLDRFVSACQADARIIAAFLGGSFVSGTADIYSDLDLYLITTDGGYEDFLAERHAFIQVLGEPLFLEQFGVIHGLFFIFSDETEGELWIGRESDFLNLHEGPYRVLVDKQDILANVIFPAQPADFIEQTERLRRLISGFWHEMSHFVKAMGRQQLWFAYGQLEALRHMCVNLARLQYNFADAWVGDEPYFKIEHVFPVEQLASLRTTYCPMAYHKMLQAGLVIFRFYQDIAPSLAKTHGIIYQPILERMMTKHFERLTSQDGQK